MSDEAPKPLDTVRPPEGDEDVYSSATKVGEAAPEILELVRRAEADAALKPARVPSDAKVVEAPAAPEPPEPAAFEAPAHEDAGEAAASAAAGSVAAAAETAPASTAEPVPVRMEEGIPPLSLLVLAVAVLIAGWLGYQALHAPPPTPATTPPPVVGH